MHNALEIDEIIRAILQHVKSSKKDMISVAMTCSRFSDYALNMLWREQSDLAPLIMCLPLDTWTTTHDGTIVFSREPLLAEWERVRINAARIRRLDFKNYRRFRTPPVPSAPVLQRLFELFPPATLFPKLCTLHFHAVSRLPQFRSNFFLLRQFFLPGLETLKFDVPVDVPTPEVEQLLGALSAEASGLRQLAITAGQGRSVCRFTAPEMPKLTHLSINGFDGGPMRQNIINIQNSRCLHTLTLIMHGPFDMNASSGDMPLELSTLERLSLACSRLRDCTSFLLQVATPHLSAIDIKYSTGTYKAETTTTAFIETLAASCRTSASLETITVADISPSHQRGPETPSQLHSHVFRPLLQFRRLSIVNFFDVGTYCLDDAFIEDIAVAWPDLRELRFSSVRLETSDVTFAAMLSLASKCKSLRSLQLTFNATQFPTLPYAPDGNQELWPTQTALRNLHVGHSTVSEASRFNLFLAVVFPNLARYARFGSGNSDEWRELEESWRQLLKERETSPAMVATWRDSLLQPQP